MAPQPCSCPHLLFVCLYQLCLPSELQSGSGSNPHLTASQRLLRASIRIKKAPFPLGRHSSVPDHLRLGGGAGAGSPEAQHLGTHFQNPHTSSGSAIWSVSNSIPIPPPSWPLGQHPKRNCHPTMYPYDIPSQNLSLSTHTILKPQSLPPWSIISPILLGQLLFILQNPNLDMSSSVKFP